MFCPKCGTENPQEGKFCRKCGTDLSGVARAIGNETHMGLDLVGFEALELSELGLEESIEGSGRRHKRRSEHPDELVAGGIKSAVTGLGFLVVSALLFFTGVAAGHSWWWAMLFPGFAMIASGLGNIAKAKRVEKRLAFGSGNLNRQVRPGTSQPVLDEARTDFVPPERTGRYETGEIVPPSVVEGTTRHLEMDSEGETMTLPDPNKK